MSPRRVAWSEILVCPECRGDLKQVPEGLVCERDSRLYPIVNEVPHVTEEEAVPWKMRELKSDP